MSRTYAMLGVFHNQRSSGLTIVKLLETCRSKIAAIETDPAPSILLRPSRSRRLVACAVERPILGSTSNWAATSMASMRCAAPAVPSHGPYERVPSLLRISTTLPPAVGGSLTSPSHFVSVEIWVRFGLLEPHIGGSSASSVSGPLMAIAWPSIWVAVLTIRVSGTGFSGEGWDENQGAASSGSFISQRLRARSCNGGTGWQAGYLYASSSGSKRLDAPPP
jgi:hypothetical protein